METETGVAGVEIAFDENGLVPCVTQDWSTGEVLTLAYMNEEALRRTSRVSRVRRLSLIHI